MRGVERRGTAGVECGGGHNTIVLGDDWNDKKNERKWGRGLKWTKLYGKMQQPAKSQRLQWGVPIEEAQLGWSAGVDVNPSFGVMIGTK